MDFGRSSVEIGQKMANGQLLFLALQYSMCINDFQIADTKRNHNPKDFP